MKIRLASELQADSIVDGNGLRTVCWMQGCKWNCKECQNPQTHDMNGGFEKDVDDILQFAKSKNEDPFILILDGIEDPHNLGAIIRTAETAGVHGIIIPKRRAASVNSTVTKVAAGAVEQMNIARVNNINEAIRYLKENDVWVCGTDIDTNTYYYNQDLTGNLAIVIGSEGFGMGKLVKDNCDFLVKIPMKGKITSLNASVSAGIIIYESVKQRNIAN